MQQTERDRLRASDPATIGISPHLTLEYFRAHTGIDIVFVPYKGAAPALADAMGNQIRVCASAPSTPGGVGVWWPRVARAQLVATAAEVIECGTAVLNDDLLDTVLESATVARDLAAEIGSFRNDPIPRVRH